MVFHPKISIVTPTYNRASKVCRLIDSSLELVRGGYAHELILVDDGSTDHTVELVSTKYADELDSGLLILQAVKENLGVTGARNAGILLAKGEWLVFIDSDDVFVQGVGPSLVEKIEQYGNYDILFFRCFDIECQVIGSALIDRVIGMNELYNGKDFFECMPVIRKDVLLRFPFIERLRGGESIAFIRMLDNGCTALVVDVVARVYNTDGADRLCKNNRRRSYSLFLFYLEKMRYVKYSNLSTFVEMCFKMIFYYIMYIYDRERSVKVSL